MTSFDRAVDQGFSLLELVLVIVIVGALTLVAGPFIGQSVLGLVQGVDLQSSERERELALQRFRREIRQADHVEIRDAGSELVLSRPGSSNPALCLRLAGATLELAEPAGDPPECTGNSLGPLARDVAGVEFSLVGDDPDGLRYRMVLTIQGVTPAYESVAANRRMIPRND